MTDIPNRGIILIGEMAPASASGSLALRLGRGGTFPMPTMVLADGNVLASVGQCAPRVS